MASKKKLRGRIRAWKSDYNVLYENLSAARKSLVDLRAEVKAEYTEYEADLNASQAREEVAAVKLKVAEVELAKRVDQGPTLDKVIRERDKALRELQAARVAAEALQRALYPVTYAKGGVLPATVTASKQAPYGDVLLSGETYGSIMGLMNKSWKPQAYQSPKPAADPKPDA